LVPRQGIELSPKAKTVMLDYFTSPVGDGPRHCTQARNDRHDDVRLDDKMIEDVKAVIANQGFRRKWQGKILIKQGLAKSGDSFILGAGIPFGSSGATNTMVVDKV